MHNNNFTTKPHTTNKHTPKNLQQLTNEQTENLHTHFFIIIVVKCFVLFLCCSYCEILFSYVWFLLFHLLLLQFAFYCCCFCCWEEDLPTERPTDPKHSSSSRMLCNIGLFAHLLYACSFPYSIVLTFRFFSVFCGVCIWMMSKWEWLWI